MKNEGTRFSTTSKAGWRRLEFFAASIITNSPPPPPYRGVGGGRMDMEVEVSTLSTLKIRVGFIDLHLQAGCRWSTANRWGGG